MVSGQSLLDKQHSYSVMIVDDEWNARKDIAQSLSSYPEFKVVAEAENMRETWLALENNPEIDGIFLDIHIQNESEEAGLDFAKRLNDLPNKPWIIFVSGSSHHALEAIRVHPVHYLMKPLSNDMVFEAVKQVKKLHPIQPKTKAKTTIELKQRLLNVQGEYEFAHVRLKADEVMSLSIITDVPKSTCKVQLSDGTTLENVYDFTIKDFIADYKYLGFIQIQRSHIINLKYFHSHKVGGLGFDRHVITLRCGNCKNELPVGDKYFKKLKQQISQLS